MYVVSTYPTQIQDLQNYSNSPEHPKCPSVGKKIANIYSYTTHYRSAMETDSQHTTVILKIITLSFQSST